jgi:hypothetical protein
VNERHNRAHLVPLCFLVLLVSVCILLLTGCLEDTSEPAGSATASATTAPTSPPPGSTGEEIFGQLHDLAVTPDGTVWAATGEGLMRLQGVGWESILEGKEANALAIAADGSLWVGLGGQVQRLDGASWETVFSCGEHLPRGKVLDIEFTLSGAVWIANGFGLASFDGQEWTTYDRLINSLVVAPDGALWMNGWEGTQGSFFVARFDGEKWTTLKGADSFPGGFLLGAVTPDGLLWGTVPGGGLASFVGLSWEDERSWTLYSRAGELPLDEVLTMAVAPDGALWVGMSSGAARFDGAWTAYAKGHAVRAIAFGSQGEVWLDTTVLYPAELE